MFQIDNSSAATTQPASTSQGTPGFFTDGNATTGAAPTIVPAEWLNALMMELINLITGAGLTLSKAAFTQVLQAVKRLAQKTTILADTGAVNAYTASNVPALAATDLIDGLAQQVRIVHANTGPSTYAPDGLTASPIYGLALQPLQGGEMPANSVAVLMRVTIASLNGGNPIWVLMECAGGASQTGQATQSNHALPLGQAQMAIQENLYSASVAGGTSDALTGSFTPAITATTMASGVVDVTVRAVSANTTQTPTFTPNAGVIAPAVIVKGNGLPLAAGDIAGAGHWITLQWDATLSKWVLLNPANGVTTQSGATPLQSVFASVGSNALTLGLNPTTLNFRNASLTGGTPSSVTIGAVLSLIVPSGATLGSTNGNPSQLALLALNNAGAVSLGVVNITNGSILLDETGLISTTAISSGSTNAGVVYSSAALTNVPYRVVGLFNVTETTAGTWAAAPTQDIGAGGGALASLGTLGVGQTWQNVTASRASGTTYYNTTGRPIMVSVWTANISNSVISAYVNGLQMGQTAAYQSSGITAQVGLTFIVPPGQSYSVNLSMGGWWELR